MKTTPADDNHPHSIYGASGASRWRTCPGSNRVIQEALDNGDIVKKASSKYADEGTIAHDWATKVLTDEISLGEVPDEFRLHLEGYIVHCITIEEIAKEISPSDALVLNEKMVPLFYRSQDKGTVDHAVICPDFIHLTDLKYGEGIKVDAVENDQGQVYTISLIDYLETMHGLDFSDDTPVYISIYQPRHFSFTGEADTWEVTVGFLREAAGQIERDYNEARRLYRQGYCDGDLKPSDKACQWCDAKKVCRVRAKTSFGGLPSPLDIEADFDFETDTKDPLPPAKEFDRETLTPGQIAWMCINGPIITKIIKDVTDGETKRLQAGGEIRLVKLVKGKLGNRTFRDKKEAEKIVRGILGTQEAYKPRELLTAPQVIAKAKAVISELSTIAKLRLGLADEKTAAKAKTECLIHRPEGKPKLVSVDDEAEAINYTSIEDDFDVEDDLI